MSLEKPKAFNHIEIGVIRVQGTDRKSQMCVAQGHEKSKEIKTRMQLVSILQLTIVKQNRRSVEWGVDLIVQTQKFFLHVHRETEVAQEEIHVSAVEKNVLWLDIGVQNIFVM